MNLKMKTKTKVNTLAGIMAVVICFTAVPVIDVNASGNSSRWSKTINWEETIAPALKNQQTNKEGVYQQIKLGIQYKVISEGMIMHLYGGDEVNLPSEVIEKLYDEGYISGYLYKKMSGQQLTQEDIPNTVFDATYYYSKYEDLRQLIGTDADALFQHFITTGMSEGRVASTGFILEAYKKNYPELVKELGNNNAAYYEHYILFGISEGRVADRIVK